MTVSISFDTLKYSKKLIEAGIPTKQAEALAEAQTEILLEISTHTFYLIYP